MNIALDYDQTYTLDPPFWRGVILAAQSRGHRVFIVTMRYESECFPSFGMFDPYLVHDAKVQIVPTGRMAKRIACAQRGIVIDVWIDDWPQAVDNDAQTIWGTVMPEGFIIDHGQQKPSL